MAGLANGCDECVIHYPRHRRRSHREAEGVDRAGAALCRRTAPPLETDRRRPELHVVGPAFRHAGDRHPDIGRHFGRRLHPSERLRRRDHDAPWAAGHGRGRRVHHGNHPQEHPRAGDRSDDSGRRGRQEGEGRRDRDAGADAPAGRDHHGRAADGRPPDAGAALHHRHAGKATDEADYLVSGNGRRGTVRLIKSGEVSEVGARK